MDIDEDDSVWLEACISAVESVEKGLEESSKKGTASDGSSNTGARTNNQSTPMGISDVSSSSLRATGKEKQLLASPTSSLAQSSCAQHPSRYGRNALGQRSLAKYTGYRREGEGVVEQAFSARGSGNSEHRSPTPSGAIERRASVPRSSREPHGIQGVGAHPDESEIVQQAHHDNKVDPCWRCGEAVRILNFGGGSYYGCSSYPLCKATRRSHQNGAVIELVASEQRSAALSGVVPTGEAEGGGVKRCHLSVTVRGGDDAHERVAWTMLGRNGIFPQEQGGSCDGEGTSGNSGRWVQRRAVLELGQRNHVKRLIKKEGMSLRDLPQTTYSRLMSSGAGAPASGGRRKKQADQSSLEPLQACETLLYSLTHELRNTLLPFQRDGVLYGLRRKGRCLIGDEMGTGKTLQALGVMGCYRGDWPLLIVSPASMRLMWAEEVEHWYPFLSPNDIHLIKGSKDKLYLADLDKCLWPQVVIVSYYMLRMLADSIGKFDWKAVIFDESHMISTKLGDERAQAQQVTVCLNVAQRASRVVMLSGTPSLSKPFDLFNQVEALSPGLLGTPPLSKAKYEFASNYCGGTMRGQISRNGEVNRVPFISGSDFPDELHLLLKNEVMIRRLKANVVDQLPPIRRIVVRVEGHSADLRRALRSGGFEDDAEDEEDEGHASRSSGRRAGAMSEDQRAGLKKVKSASEWVVDKLNASAETLTKFVVFAHHRSVLDRLQEAFEEAGTLRQGSTDQELQNGFTCVRIDGEVPTATRASRLLEFNGHERCRVLVVSITAGGQGLDFTAACNVVFVELPETPAWLRQAEDRLHRRRQEKGVNVYLTVLPSGSNDDSRWLKLNEKLLIQTSVMNGTERAENIDVDHIFDAGGLGSGESSGSNASWRRQRRRYGDGSLLRDDDSSDGDDASNAVSVSSSSRDMGDPVGDDEGGDNTAEAVLDAEIAAALLMTPLEVPDHRPSQSPTLRMLRQIAESPARHVSRMSAKAKRSSPKTCVNVDFTTRREEGKKKGRSKFAVNDDVCTKSPRIFTPAMNRKRPRPSPRSDGKSPFNPFKAFRHPCLPPPAPGAPGSTRPRAYEGGNAGGSSGGVSDEGDGIGALEGLDDDDDFVSPVKRMPREMRGASRSSLGEGRCVSSPVLLVDSSSGEEEADAEDGSSGGANPSGPSPTQRSESIHFRLPRGASGGHEIEGAVDRASSRNDTSVRVGRSTEEDQNSQIAEDKDTLHARKLSFLVSVNTGRVHVYRDSDVEDHGDEVSGNSDDEDRLPQHCRCNFRPTDLDRLFEAAKEASLPSSEWRAGQNFEAVAREMLQNLPNVVRSAPALKVARSFVQEWRALPSRKRPLLKGTPCRPPLTEQLAQITPRLTGSTRRYSNVATPARTAGDRSAVSASSSTNGREAFEQVLCAFCEEEPASEQREAYAVHRRDRFCSVECMEASSSRSSSGSLRHLVLERDHGVCSMRRCGRDCLSVVSRLKAVQDRQARREILEDADPRFSADRNHTLRERLVKLPRAGNAWEADHVVAVFQGGGECGIDNLRTLCVLCHAEVTRAQTAERAIERRASKENERRLREEAQGQRRLVSFRGGITLSAPSQESESGQRCEGQSANHAVDLHSDESDAVEWMESVDETPVISTTVATAVTRTGSAFSRQRISTCARRQDEVIPIDEGSKVGRSFSGEDTRCEGKRVAMRQPSMDAFERLISGQDFALHPSPDPENPKPPVNGTDGASRTAGDADDEWEIAYTRVRRVHRSSGGSLGHPGAV